MSRDLMGIQPGSQGSTTLSDGSEVQMPLLTYRASSFAAYFTISADKARALLPSDELLPLRVTPDRALVCVQAMEYTDKTTDPYSEFGFSIPVHRSPEADAPGLAMEAWEELPGSGSYITHLGVSTEQARLIGWEILGFPKFIADVQLTETAAERVAEATADGETVLTLAVTKAEQHEQERREFSIYSLSPVEHTLFHIPYQAEVTAGMTQGAQSARLQLGSHPAADELRGLELSSEPVFAVDIPQYTLISNRPDERIDVGDWEDPRSIYRDLRTGALTPAGLKA